VARKHERAFIWFAGKMKKRWWKRSPTKYMNFHRIAQNIIWKKEKLFLHLSPPLFLSLSLSLSLCYFNIWQVLLETSEKQKEYKKEKIYIHNYYKQFYCCYLLLLFIIYFYHILYCRLCLIVHICTQIEKFYLFKLCKFRGSLVLDKLSRNEGPRGSACGLQLIHVCHVTRDVILWIRTIRVLPF